MSPTKVFITGASGYIGGSVLNSLVNEFPDLSVTALVRNEEKAGKITAAHPNVKIAIGDFSSKDVIEKAAEESDIVIHTESDILPAVTAIIDGLTRRSAPSYLIHTSGTAIVADTQPSAPYGQPPTKTWSDITDLPTISTFPDTHWHRHVDKLILPLSAATNNKIRTAIICPPDIYGVGTGTGNRQSFLLPLYVEELRTNPTAGPFVVGEGKNVKSLTHVLDVVDVYMRLVSEALQPDGGRADWGADGFYFTATSGLSFPEFAVKVIAIAKRRGWLPETTPEEVQHYSVEKVRTVLGGLGPYMWGANSVTKADRLEKIFGWKGKAPSWQESLEGDMELAFGGAGVDRGSVLKERLGV